MAQANSTTPDNPEVEATIAILNASIPALFFAIATSLILFGIISSQTFTYFQRYREDRRSLRVAVGTLWLSDIVQEVCLIICLFNVLETEFSPSKLKRIVSCINGSNIAACISNTIVRCIFSFQIWKLSKGKVVVIMIPLLMSLIVVATTLAAVVKVLLVKDAWVSDELNAVGFLNYIVYGAGAIADVSITTTLCYYFSRGFTGRDQTDAVLRFLEVCCIRSGLLACFGHVSALATYATLPHTVIYLASAIIAEKLYVSSLLASLNVRKYLKEFTEGRKPSIPLGHMFGYLGHQYHQYHHDTSYRSKSHGRESKIERSYDQDTEASGSKSRVMEPIAVQVETIVERTEEYLDGRPVEVYNMNQPLAI